jgi:hypothetical protein
MGGMLRSIQIKIRIEKSLYDGLKEIAAEGFEDNLSMVVRLALRQFRDRRRPHARTPGTERPDPSS